MAELILSPELIHKLGYLILKIEATYIAGTIAIV